MSSGMWWEMAEVLESVHDRHEDLVDLVALESVALHLVCQGWHQHSAHHEQRDLVGHGPGSQHSCLGFRQLAAQLVHWGVAAIGHRVHAQDAQGLLEGLELENRSVPPVESQLDRAAFGGLGLVTGSNDRCTDFAGLRWMSCASNQSLQMSASSWRSARFDAVRVRSSA